MPRVAPLRSSTRRSCAHVRVARIRGLLFRLLLEDVLLPQVAGRRYDPLAKRLLRAAPPPGREPHRAAPECNPGATSLLFVCGWGEGSDDDRCRGPAQYGLQGTVASEGGREAFRQHSLSLAAIGGWEVSRAALWSVGGTGTTNALQVLHRDVQQRQERGEEQLARAIEHQELPGDSLMDRRIVNTRPLRQRLSPSGSPSP